MKGVFSIRVFEWKILVENPCPTNADPACLRRRFTTGFRRFSLPPLFYLSRGEERRALLAMEGHLKVFILFFFCGSPALLLLVFGPVVFLMPIIYLHCVRIYLWNFSRISNSTFDLAFLPSFSFLFFLFFFSSNLYLIRSWKSIVITFYRSLPFFLFDI